MKYSAVLVAVGALGVGTAFAQEPIRIGAMYPLTGGGAVYGVPAMVGHQLAVEELNAKGGIMGRKIESIERDDKMNPSAASPRRLGWPCPRCRSKRRSSTSRPSPRPSR